MDVQPTNQQPLRDDIMSMFSKISKECLQHRVESRPRRINKVLKAKSVQLCTSKVYLIKWQRRACIHVFYIFGKVLFHSQSASLTG